MNSFKNTNSQSTSATFSPRRPTQRSAGSSDRSELPSASQSSNGSWAIILDKQPATSEENEEGNIIWTTPARGLMDSLLNSACEPKPSIPPTGRLVPTRELTRGQLRWWIVNYCMLYDTESSRDEKEDIISSWKGDGARLSCLLVEDGQDVFTNLQKCFPRPWAWNISWYLKQTGYIMVDLAGGTEEAFEYYENLKPSGLTY